MTESQKIKETILKIFTEDKIRQDITNHLIFFSNYYNDNTYKRVNDSIWEVALYPENVEINQQAIKRICIDIQKDDIKFINYHFISKEFAGIYYKIKLVLGKFYSDAEFPVLYEIEKCFVLLEYNHDFSCFDIKFIWDDFYCVSPI